MASESRKNWLRLNLKGIIAICEDAIRIVDNYEDLGERRVFYLQIAQLVASVGVFMGQVFAEETLIPPTLPAPPPPVKEEPVTPPEIIREPEAVQEAWIPTEDSVLGSATVETTDNSEGVTG